MTELQGNEPHESEERWSALRDLDEWLRTPMMVLSFVWLILVIIELAWGTSRALEVFGTTIWIVFILEFAVRLTLAPAKGAFLKRNWLTVVALVVPAFRLLRGFRALRLARAARGFRLVRIVGTANRGMNALRASLRRRGLGYVIGLTVTIALLGAGGMLAFEPASEVEGGFESYLDALWWTGMLLATMGSEVLAEERGGPYPVLPPSALRLCCVRVHHRELRLVLRRARRSLTRGGNCGCG